MPLPELAQYAAASLLTLVLAWAAISDVRERKIPNLAVIAVLGLFVVWIVARGGYGLVSAGGAFGIALGGTVALYLLRIIGAGDSKLFVACAPFMGLGYLPAFALATALTGGVIALISLASRPQRALVMLTLRGKGDYGRGVPYGVAIAVGAVLVLWASMLGYLPPFGDTRHLNLHDMRATFAR
jgi:prepilin peptidase CpaA